MAFCAALSPSWRTVLSRPYPAAIHPIANGPDHIASMHPARGMPCHRSTPVFDERSNRPRYSFVIKYGAKNCSIKAPNVAMLLPANAYSSNMSVSSSPRTSDGAGGPGINKCFACGQRFGMVTKCGFVGGDCHSNL